MITRIEVSPHKIYPTRFDNTKNHISMDFNFDNALDDLRDTILTFDFSDFASKDTKIKSCSGHRS
jgi:hypothetical protein